MLVTDSAVRIVDVPPVRVAVLEHRGDPRRVEESVRRFVAWRRQAQLSRATHATFNIFYTAIDGTAPADFRLGLCVATDDDVQPNDAGVMAATLPGGRCAVMRHVGTDAALPEAAAYLCGAWLGRSGESRRDFPLYCQRVRFFPDVPQHEAIVDLFLPLK